VEGYRQSHPFVNALTGVNGLAGELAHLLLYNGRSKAGIALLAADRQTTEPLCRDTAISPLGLLPRECQCLVEGHGPALLPGRLHGRLAQRFASGLARVGEVD
jgi:hypothetical protein